MKYRMPGPRLEARPGSGRSPAEIGTPNFIFRPIQHDGMMGVILTLLLCLMPAAFSADGTAADGVLPGWHPFWSRDRHAGRATLEKIEGEESSAIKVEHRGTRDWCLNRDQRIDVKPGDIIEITARLKVSKDGNVVVGAATRDRKGKVVEWAYGAATAPASPEWKTVHSRFVIPDGAASIEPRIIGNGPATVWVGAFSAEKAGSIESIRDAKMPAEITVANRALKVSLATDKGTLSVLDHRTNRTWNQRAFRDEILIRSARQSGNRIEWSWFGKSTALEGRAALSLEGERPEFVVSLTAEGRLARPLPYPHPFTAEPPAYLVVPMNEGISYPVDDATVRPRRLIAYGGHGICMAFWGVTDGEAGQMAIIETAGDAAVRIERIDGHLAIVPEWQSQKGQFGYERRLRYVFFDSGGHVAMCKRYRAYAKKTGLLKTLAEKRRANPDVDELIGAVNVWCWDRNAPELVRELQEAGIERILWSNRRPPEQLQALNEMGVLTSRYDIYQDVMNPENFKRLRGVHPDWTTEAWPKHLMIGGNGDWTRGWRVRARDGSMIPCGVLCDREAIPYADARISEELKTHPYRCRFIDTTTASPWRECYNPNHPMTRSDSRRYKMDLLARVSQKFNLVCGSETGHDAAVPYVHYFEGMLSLGPYRVPDAGRNMRRIWDEVPERVAKFQVGHPYRLPLWELVYHDCVVAQWYWGDYNNKLPALWDKRDLFNALYGTPPMFMFDRKLWRENRDRFIQSYKTIGPIARATGYSEMVDHRFLAADRSVQRTEFANGVKVTANFGGTAYRLPDGTTISPMRTHVEGLEASK